MKECWQWISIKMNHENICERKLEEQAMGKLQKVAGLSNLLTILKQVKLDINASNVIQFLSMWPRLTVIIVYGQQSAKLWVCGAFIIVKSYWYSVWWRVCVVH